MTTTSTEQLERQMQQEQEPELEQQGQQDLQEQIQREVQEATAEVTDDVVEVADDVAEVSTSVTGDNGSSFEVDLTDTLPADAPEAVVDQIIAQQHPSYAFLGGLFLETSPGGQAGPITPHGDGSYSVTITQAHDQQHPIQGEGRGMTRTVTYTFKLDETIPDTTVAPEGRFLLDDPATTEADGLITGDTPEARADDASVERAATTWLAVVGQFGTAPDWTEGEWLQFSLGFNSGVQADPPTPAQWEEFFDTNVGADCTLNDTLSGAVVDTYGERAVRNAWADAPLLAHSSTAQTQAQADPDNEVPETALIVPADTAATRAQFASDVKNQLLKTAMTPFAADDDNREFLLTGISPEDVANGLVSEESLQNHALIGAIMWVGRELMETGAGDWWTGPTPAELGDPLFLLPDTPDTPNPHAVYEVSYLEDGIPETGFVDAAGLARLQSDADVDGLTSTHVTDPGQVRLFWASTAMQTYSALGKQPPVETMLAQSFQVLYNHYKPGTVPQSMTATVVDNNQGIDGAHPLAPSGNGNLLAPFLSTDRIDATPQSTDAEALAFMADTLGIPVGANLDGMMGQARGGVTVVGLVSGWASDAPYHDDHVAKDAADTRLMTYKTDIATALGGRERDPELVEALLQDRIDDIQHNRAWNVGTIAVAGLLEFGTAGLQAARLGARSQTVTFEGKLYELTVESASAFEKLLIEEKTTQEKFYSLLAHGAFVTPEMGANFAATSLAGGQVAGFEIYQSGAAGAPPAVIGTSLVPDPTLTGADQIAAIDLALKVSNEYHENGAAHAADMLINNTLLGEPGDAVDALQYLEGPVHAAVQAELKERADDRILTLIEDLETADLDSPAGQQEVGRWLGLASPAVAGAVLTHIEDTYGQDKAVGVMQNMHPNVLGHALLHEQAVAPDAPDAETPMLDLFGEMAKTNPDQTALVIDAMFIADPLQTGDLLGELEVKIGADAVAAALIKMDPVKTGDLLAATFENEKHESFVGNTNFDINTSSALEMAEELVADGAALGLQDQVNMTLFRFVTDQQVGDPFALAATLDQKTPTSLDALEAWVAAPLSKLGENAPELPAPGIVEIAVDAFLKLPVAQQVAQFVTLNSGNGPVPAPIPGDTPEPHDFLSKLNSDILGEMDVDEQADFFKEAYDSNPDFAADRIADVIQNPDPLIPTPPGLFDAIASKFTPQDLGALAGAVALTLGNGLGNGDAITTTSFADATANPFGQAAKSQLDTMTTPDAAAFLIGAGADVAADYLFDVDVNNGADVLQEMAKLDTRMAAATLRNLYTEDPVKPGEILRRMTYGFAADTLTEVDRQYVATATATQPTDADADADADAQPVPPSAGDILETIPAGEAAGIIAHLDDETANAVLENTTNAEWVNAVEGYFSRGGTHAANAAQPLRLSVSSEFGLRGGIMTQAEVDALDRPAILVGAPDQQFAVISGQAVELPNGLTAVVAQVDQSPSNPLTGFQPGYRRLVAVEGTGAFATGREFVPVDDQGNVIPGIIVRPDPETGKLYAENAPIALHATPAKVMHRLGFYGAEAGNPGETATAFLERTQGAVRTFYPPGATPDQIQSYTYGVYNLDREAGGEPLVGSPVPEILEILAQPTVDAAGANRLMYLVDETTPEYANGLSAQDRLDILRIAEEHNLPLSVNGAIVLGTRPIDGGPDDRISDPTLRAEADGRIAAMLDELRVGLAPEFEEGVDVLLQPFGRPLLNVIIERIGDIMRDVYQLPNVKVEIADNNLNGDAAFFSPLQNTVFLSPRLVDTLWQNPQALAGAIAHEFTHAYQHDLVNKLDAGTLTPGSPEHDEALLMRASFAAGNVLRGRPALRQQYYHRFWHEGDAHYVQDSLWTQLNNYVNQEYGTDLQTRYQHTEHGAYVASYYDATRGESLFGSRPSPQQQDDTGQDPPT